MAKVIMHLQYMSQIWKHVFFIYDIGKLHQQQIYAFMMSERNMSNHFRKTCVHTCGYGGKSVDGPETCPLKYGIAIGLHLDNLIQLCNSVRNLAFGNRHGISRLRWYPSDFVPIQSRQPDPRPWCSLQQTMKKCCF